MRVIGVMVRDREEGHGNGIGGGPEKNWSERMTSPDSRSRYLAWHCGNRRSAKEIEKKYFFQQPRNIPLDEVF